MNKILYVCSDFTKLSDGARIYDFNLSKSLIDLGYNVDVYFVKNFSKSLSIPLWKKKVSIEEKKHLKKIRSQYDCVILSHEIFSDLSKILQPDLFIIHNLFSIFESPNFLIKTYYRLFSSVTEKKVFKFSRKVLILSSREMKYLSKLYSLDKIICEPPGIKEISKTNVDYSKIKISGSYDWLPKRLSRLSDIERSELDKFINIIDSNNNITSCSLIEENFVSGFKLKLLQMIFFGDVIFSMVDLKDELDFLGLDSTFFYKIGSVLEINNRFTNLNLANVSQVKEYNQKILLDKYKWIDIAERIMKRL